MYIHIYIHVYIYVCVWYDMISYRIMWYDMCHSVCVCLCDWIHIECIHMMGSEYKWLRVTRLGMPRLTVSRSRICHQLVDSDSIPFGFDRLMCLICPGSVPAPVFSHDRDLLEYSIPSAQRFRPSRSSNSSNKCRLGSALKPKISPHMSKQNGISLVEVELWIILAMMWGNSVCLGALFFNICPSVVVGALWISDLFEFESWFNHWPLETWAIWHTAQHSTAIHLDMRKHVSWCFSQYLARSNQQQLPTKLIRNPSQAVQVHPNPSKIRSNVDVEPSAFAASWHRSASLPGTGQPGCWDR